MGGEEVAGGAEIASMVVIKLMKWGLLVEQKLHISLLFIAPRDYLRHGKLESECRLAAQLRDSLVLPSHLSPRLPY
jgi:hypothetical protein